MPFREKLRDVCLKCLFLCWAFACELNKYRPSGKLIAILCAILNRPLASPRLTFSASIKGAMSLHTHARGNENKLEKVG